MRALCALIHLLLTLSKVPISFFLMHNVAHNQMYNIYYCNTLLNFYHVGNYFLDLQLVISRNSECHLYIFIRLRISGYFCYYLYL